MSYYFVALHKTRYRGARRTTIVSTLQADIKRTKEFITKINEEKSKKNNCILQKFQIDSLQSFQDLIKIRQIATDRKLLQKITKSVIEADQAEYTKDLVN